MARRMFAIDHQPPLQVQCQQRRQAHPAPPRSPSTNSKWQSTLGPPHCRDIFGGCVSARPCRLPQPMTCGPYTRFAKLRHEAGTAHERRRTQGVSFIARMESLLLVTVLSAQQEVEIDLRPNLNAKSRQHSCGAALAAEVLLENRWSSIEQGDVFYHRADRRSNGRFPGRRRPRRRIGQCPTGLDHRLPRGSRTIASG